MADITSLTETKTGKRNKLEDKSGLRTAQQVKKDFTKKPVFFFAFLLRDIKMKNG